MKPVSQAVRDLRRKHFMSLPTRKLTAEQYRKLGRYLAAQDAKVRSYERMKEE
jgi:hypothetical protein